MPVLYDVIVVGGGPAGATAARAAAQNGLATLLLEREVYPRSKPCAGGVTTAALHALDFPLPSWAVERTCHDLRPCFGETGLSISRAEPVIAMVSRETFDEYLKLKAEEAGAEVKQGLKVLAVLTEPGSVTVRTDHGAYRGRLVVGADGVFSTVAKSVRPPFTRRDLGLAQWAELPCDPVSLNPFYTGGLEVRYGTPANGYGWIFPKRDHLSVGIGTVAPHLKAPREEFWRFLQISGLPRPERVRGYFLPLGGRRRRVTAFRTMLAGDAAGFVDPFTGEGIRYAILSGRVAGNVARAALDRSLRSPGTEPYAAQCARLFGRDLGYARLLLEVFLRVNDEMNAYLFRHPVLFERLADVFQGKGTYQELVGKFGARLPQLWLRGMLRATKAPETPGISG